jgi:D-arabinose 1-dehydrogenase-like Zn-dependent alcohol dehydrogenase
MGIQYGNIMEHKTLAVDVKDKQFEFARNTSATTTINSKSVKSGEDEEDGITGTHGDQVALTTSGICAAYSTAFKTTCSHERIVVIGLARGHLTLTTDAFLIAKSACLFISRQIVGWRDISARAKVYQGMC